MTCPRCTGLMLPIRYGDHELVSGLYDGWSCINCGDVLDAVIQQNRLTPAPPVKTIENAEHRPIVVGKG